MARIHIGRFDQFKNGADAILIGVDAVGLTTLIESVTALASGSPPRAEFHHLPAVTAHGGVTLDGEVTSDDLGLREVRRGECIWCLSKTGWAERADLLSGLKGATAAHQYLEGPTDPILVIVSTGEYPEDWWWSVFGGKPETHA